MANKYSEELFGAVDAIIRKRFEELNKDTTILCEIEDNSEAEDGKYIVLNNALRFDAYSEKTDYAVGQNVWVLVPSGDYNSTKIIVGKYVSPETESFTWVDPFKNFIDMTGNLAENFKDIGLQLIANDPLPSGKEISLGNIVDETVTINGRSGINIINGLKGLDRIAVSADFATQFSSGGDAPYAGDYGLRIDLVTDKAVDNEHTFYLNTNKMNGNLYASNGVYFEQKVVYDFDPEEIGNIVKITCTFYQNQDFINKNGKYNLDKFGNIVNRTPDIAVKNIKIMMGYSSTKITDTTALLSSFGASFFTVETFDNERLLVPRFAYNNGDGTFTFINTYEDYINAEERNSILKRLKLHLYYQDNKQAMAEPRLSQPYYRESWERTQLDPSDVSWEKWETSKDFTENFEIPVVFTNANAANERLRIAFSFKRSSSQLDSIESTFKDIIRKLNNSFFSNKEITFQLYDNDIDLIQLIVSYINKWYETKNEILTDFGFQIIDEENPELPARYNRYYISANESMTEKENFLWNCIITLICMTYDNENEDYISFTDEENNLQECKGTYINEENKLVNDEFGEKYHAFSKYLIHKIIVKRYSYNKINVFRNFEKVRSILENTYISLPLTFTNTTNSEDNVLDTVQGLQLEPKDAQGGIYTLYKASTNANSELIKPSDANIKRNIEASFYSIAKGGEDLASANRIYWLIPKDKTMITEPVINVTFGDEIYNPLEYNVSDFISWASNYSENGMFLYYKNTNSTYTKIVYKNGFYYLNINENDSSKHYTKAEDLFWEMVGGASTNESINLYTKNKLFLVVDNENNLPTGAVMKDRADNISNINTLEGYALHDARNVGDSFSINDYILAVYGDEEYEIAQLTLNEREFLKNSFKNNYWVIFEDRYSTTKEGNNLQKATIAYQIKNVFRKSFTNNRIYATIFRNDNKYSNNVELFFGVKGTNDANYTLLLTPVEEDIYQGANNIITETAPSAWTKGSAVGSTYKIRIRANLYDNEDKDISHNFTFVFSIYKGDNHYLDIDAAYQTTGHPQFTQIGRGQSYGNVNSGGIIIKCDAYKQGENTIAITQYYILPMRLSREYAYLDGPDTVVYDANKINPSYHNIIYALRDNGYNEITFNTGEQLKSEVLIANENTHANFLPKITDGYLTPALSYVEDEGYDFYIKFSRISGETVLEDLWWQPILITLNNYTNTLVDTVGDKKVRSGDNKQTASSVMTVVKRNNNDELTGIIIGSLPVEEIDEEHKAERSGILGYLNNVEKYAFLDNGRAFINGNGITLDTSGNCSVNTNVITGVLEVAKGGTGLNAAPSMIVDLASNQSTNVFTSTPKPGVEGILGISNGGTGTNSLATLWENLGGNDSGTHEENYYALAEHGIHVPTLPVTPTNTTFLRADNTWYNLTLGDLGVSISTSSNPAAITVNGTRVSQYTHPTTEGNKHIPSGGSSGQFLTYDSAGTAAWGNLPSASTSVSGIVQLYDNINSTSTTVAATANAVKTAYDTGNQALTAINTLNTNFNTNVATAIQAIMESASDPDNPIYITLNGIDYRLNKATIDGQTVLVLI